MTRTRRVILAVIALTIAIPSVGRAAVSVPLTVQFFGDRMIDNPKTPFDDRYVLFADSLPTGVGVRGRLHLQGHTLPGALVHFDVTDGTAVAHQQFATTTRDGAGTVAGDFDTDLNVTNLGIHFAGPKETLPDGTVEGSCVEIPRPPSCDPNSLNPADWGGSDLIATVYVTAVVDGQPVTSDTISQTITKYAGTPHDTYAPGWLILTKSGTLPGQSANSPDLAWPPCDWFHYVLTGIQNQAHPDSCGRASQFDGTSRAEAYGEATDSQTKYGIASEMADFTITISQGTDILMQTTSIYRDGLLGSFDIPLFIDQFAPNLPPSAAYTIDVQGRDAWGNLDAFGQYLDASSGFRVFPA